MVIGDKEGSRWEERRRRTLDWAGIKEKELKKRRKEKETQKVVRWNGRKVADKIDEERTEKLEKLKYNGEYKEIRIGGSQRREVDREVGNEMRAKLHWLDEKDRVYRICGEKEEKMEHVL